MRLVRVQKSPGPGRECSGVGQQLELALKATTQHTLTHTHSGKRHTRARAYVTHMLPMAAGRHRRQGVRRVCVRTRPHASVRFVLGAFGCCLPMTPHHSTPLCQPTTAPPTPVLSAPCVSVCVSHYTTPRRSSLNGLAAGLRAVCHMCVRVDVDTRCAMRSAWVRWWLARGVN